MLMWRGSSWPLQFCLCVLLLSGYLAIWALFWSGNKIPFTKTKGFLTAMFRDMKVQSDNSEQITILRSRSQHLQHACSLMNETERPRAPRLDTMIFNREHQLLYCPIEKVGSSTWKRVLKVLNNNNKTVLSMPSMSAHSGLKNHVLRRDMGEERDTILATYTSFMFVRDPFSRLLSAYMDKVLLPNPIGEALSNLKIAPFLQQAQPGSLKGCHTNITFSEFCAYLVHAIHTGEHLDPHFTPISQHCDPCGLSYTYIGKMETMVEDTKAILGVKGLDFDQITGKKEDFESENELSIMHDVIKRTFSFTQRKKRLCWSNLHALTRLWLDFKLRGYIPLSSHFPYKHLERLEELNISDAEWNNVLLKDFELRVRAAYSIPRSRAQRRRDKESMMVPAFRSVPMATLQQLASVFATDCKLFGYSCDVMGRFFTA